jgi:hypothetical protein
MAQGILALALLLALTSFTFSAICPFGTNLWSNIPRPCSFIDFEEMRSNININAAICEFENHYCKRVDPLPQQDIIITGECIPRKVHFISYPGEKCLVDGDCLNTTCENGKCKGKRINELCSLTSDCLVGSYCANNGTSSVCKSQLGKDATCKTTNDCVNNLICINNKCSAYGSVNSGNTFTINKTTESLNQINFVCTTGTARHIEGNIYQCDDLYYVKNGKPNKDNIECKVDYADCRIYYNDDNGGRIYHGAEVCTCGYHSVGLSFCPSLNVDERRKKLIDFILTKNSDCHSANRFSCFRNDNATRKEYNSLYIFAYNFHLLRYAPTEFVNMFDGENI